MRKKLVVIVAAAVALAIGGVALAYVLIRDTPEGQLDTELADVTLVTLSPPPPPEPPPVEPPAVEPPASEEE